MSTLDALLLRALRVDQLHRPGSELAALLDTTLSALESRIRVLGEAGFEIEHAPGLGYRLLKSPDRLIADDIVARLDSAAFIRDVFVFKETDSTNESAARLGRAGGPAGIVIFAESQTGGRGRFGRRWESASHLGLWFSILLRPDLPLAHWPRLTTCAAVAIATAIERIVPLKVEIKWPNDLFIAGKKVAGILIETGTDQALKPFAVLGIGINVNHLATDFAPELAERATSLRIAAGATVDRPELAAAILHELESRLDGLATGFSFTLDEATERSCLLGRWVELRAGGGGGDEVVEGMAEGLDSEGRLLLRTKDGTLQVLNAGEVTGCDRP